MSLRIKDTDTVPFDGWPYLVEQTGYTVKTRNYGRLYPMIVEHCQVNNIQPPSEQAVIDDLCAKLSIPCFEGMTPLVNRFTLNLPEPQTACCSRAK